MVKLYLEQFSNIDSLGAAPKQWGVLVLDLFDQYYSKLSGWFPDVPDGEIHKFLIRPFETGELLVRKDRLFQNLYIVLDGVCDVINQLDNGSEVITLKLTSGDFIGVSESTFGSLRNIASVKACSRLYAAEMENGTFKDWLRRYPSFTDFVMKNLVTRLHYTADLAANCQTSSAKVNLAKYLLDRFHVERTSHPEDYKGPIKIQETHTMISAFLGVSPRTVERQVLSLKKEGLITTSRGKISISAAQYQELLRFITSNL